MVSERAWARRSSRVLLSLILCGATASCLPQQGIEISCLPQEVADALAEQVLDDAAFEAEDSLGDARPLTSVALHVDGSPSMSGYQERSAGADTAYAELRQAIRSYQPAGVEDADPYREFESESIGALNAVLVELGKRDWQDPNADQTVTLLLTDLWMLEQDRFYGFDRLVRRLRYLVENGASVGVLPIRSRFVGEVKLPSPDLLHLAAELGRTTPNVEPTSPTRKGGDWDPAYIEQLLDDGNERLGISDYSAAILNFRRALQKACEAVAAGNLSAQSFVEMALEKLAEIPSAGLAECPVPQQAPQQAPLEPEPTPDDSAAEADVVPEGLHETSYHFEGQRALVLILIGRADHIAHLHREVLGDFDEIGAGLSVFTSQQESGNLTSRKIVQEIKRGAATVRSGAFEAVLGPSTERRDAAIEVVLAEGESALTLEIPLSEQIIPASTVPPVLHANSRYWLHTKSGDCGSAWQPVGKNAPGLEARIEDQRLVLELARAKPDMTKGWAYFVSADVVAQMPDHAEWAIPKDVAAWSVSRDKLSSHVANLERSARAREAAGSPESWPEPQLGTPSLDVLYGELFRAQWPAPNSNVAQILMAFRSE